MLSWIRFPKMVLKAHFLVPGSWLIQIRTQWAWQPSCDPRTLERSVAFWADWVVTQPDWHAPGSARDPASVHIMTTKDTQVQSVYGFSPCVHTHSSHIPEFTHMNTCMHAYIYAKHINMHKCNSCYKCIYYNCTEVISRIP